MAFEADEFTFEALEKALFAEPTGVVFHYTSLGAFMEIVRSGNMYATDIRFLNDSTEMTHALKLVREARDLRSGAVDTVSDAGGNIPSIMDPSMPGMLLFDLDERLRGSSCYIACFTKQGNQLSQWRGYCPPRKGITIGFDAEDLRASAEEQGFVLRECIYNPKAQTLIGDRLMNVLKFLPEPHDAERMTQTYSAFQQIAAVLKHPRFAEEQECRLISKEWQWYPSQDVKHREGRSMLIPYRLFKLPKDERGRLKVARVIVGPTQHEHETVLSVTQFLALNGAARFLKRVEYCDIPLRET
jgi:Protein of unknown function (DUF2971)